MADCKSTLTQEYLKKVLDYCPETGILKWRGNPGRDNGYAGRVVNCRDKDGYIKMKVAGESHRAHRVIWFYFYGKWPPHHIDHINGVRDDNRICNLREATNQQNMWNLHAKLPNKHGAVGVFTRKDRKGFKAKLKINNKVIYLGTYKTIEEAIQARTNGEIKYFGHWRPVS